MNFEFSDDQRMLRDQARRFLEDRCGPRAVRRVLDGEGTHDAQLWAAIGEQGWTGTAIPEEWGGVGLGYLELCVLAEEMGRANAPVPFSSSVYLAAEALLQFGSPAQKEAHLPDLATGARIGTLALAERQGAVGPAQIQARLADGRLTGTKLAVPDGSYADLAVVIARSGEGERGLTACLVDLKQAAVRRETLKSLDPSRDLARLTFEGAAAEPLGAPGEGWAVLTRLFDRAAVLFAFEQLGGAQRALEMARDYAMGRFAFGRQIAGFQALKHRMADMYVANELARSNCYYGAWALASDSGDLPVAAATARVAATQAFHLAAKENIQIHGGMGFTWEFDCHLYYRRAKLLALALGSERRWKERLISLLELKNAA